VAIAGPSQGEEVFVCENASSTEGRAWLRISSRKEEARTYMCLLKVLPIG
jgi:hypothetical protein